MKHIVRLIALILLLAACGAPPGRLIIVDETGELEREQIESSATPLVERGAVVAVFLAERGDETGEDFTRRLAASGLYQGNDIQREVIALYVSFSPRYSELRAGSRWSDVLPDATLRTIRLEALNPALQEGNPSNGVAITLNRLEAELAIPMWQRLLASGWWVLGLLALATLAIFRDNPLIEQSITFVIHSPPGRFLAWLWSLTPAAQARARRRNAEETRRARYELESAQREAEATLAAARAIASHTPLLLRFETSYSHLLERRDRLATRGTNDPDLARDVRLMGGDIRRFAIPLKAYARLLRAALADELRQLRTNAPSEEALPPIIGEQLAALDARMAELEQRTDTEGDFSEAVVRLAEEFSALRECIIALHAITVHAASARQRFDQALAGGKFGKRNSKKQQQFTQQLEGLDKRRATMLASSSIPAITELKSLAAAYETLDHAIWKLQDPHTYASAMRRAAVTATFLATTTEQSSQPIPSTSSDSASSDWSTPDTGSSSGSSSDGGSW